MENLIFLKRAEFIDTENRLWLPEEGDEGWAKWVKVVKRDKLQVIR